MTDNDDATLLSRKDVAQQHGISYSKLRYYHELGLIEPRRQGPRGSFLYAEEDVRALKRHLLAREQERTPGSAAHPLGRLHAAAFELYAEGNDHRQVTVALQVPVDIALQLEGQYHRGGVVLDQATRQTVDEVLAIGGHALDWRDPKAVVALVRHLVGAELERDRLRVERDLQRSRRPRSHTRIASSDDSAAEKKSS